MDSTIAVLIPTLNRSEKLEPLLENIHEVTETAHRVYFIAQESDEATFKELERLREPRMLAVIVPDFNCYAKSTNEGYRASTEPYLFTGNDDLLFHKGWDMHALAKMDEADVVGTNDGNGRMDCFALIRREFIKQHSGVFDQPNTIFHEYLHQYPDTELADYARYRGVWAEARQAITEHLHPLFGKSDDPDHPNYVKGRIVEPTDKAEYERRRALWVA